MKEPRKGARKPNGRTQIRSMVAGLLAKIDPHGYAEQLEELRAQFRPAGDEEELLVKHLAATAWRLHGCDALHTEILRQGMEACAAEGCGLDDLLARAFLRDCEGPNLLCKLMSYENRLQNEFHYCLQALERRRTDHERAAKAARTALARLKPCTPVVQ